MTTGSARGILPPHTTRAEPQATSNIWKWQNNTSRAMSLIARLVARLEHAHTLQELARLAASGSACDSCSVWGPKRASIGRWSSTSRQIMLEALEEGYSSAFEILSRTDPLDASDSSGCHKRWCPKGNLVLLCWAFLWPSSLPSWPLTFSVW